MRLDVLYLLVLTAVLGACSHHPVRTRFAREYRCDKSIFLEDLGASAFRASGCNRTAIYVCPHRGFCVAQPEWNASLREAIGGNTTSGPAQVISAVPAPTTTISSEDELRAFVSRQSAAILACAGLDMVALELTWDAQGVFEPTLRGEFAGSPEEACVRALFAEPLRMEAEAPGRLIQAVTR